MIEFFVSHRHRPFPVGYFQAPSFYEAILLASVEWGVEPKKLTAVLGSSHRALQKLQYETN